MSKTRRVLRHLPALITIFLFFACAWALMRYISVDDTNSYTRLTMHEFYNQDDIDTLFIGASHCYLG